MDKEVEFILVVYNANKDKVAIANKIFQLITGNYVNKELSKEFNLKSKVYDVKIYGDLETSQPTIEFGQIANNATSTKGPNWTLHSLDNLVQTTENRKHREETLEFLPKIGRQINLYLTELKEEKKEQKNNYIEHEGITIGLAETDILVTESEAEYLKRIRDLFGGGKVIITKGDLKIEIEEPKK